MSIRELIYFSLASALGLSTFIVFHYARSARVKQRLWTAVHILGGAVFIAFMLGRDISALGTFFTVLGTLGVVYLSLTNSRFCADCSALVIGPERPEWRGNCPACGVRLPWSEFYPEETPSSAAPTAPAGESASEVATPPSGPGPPGGPHHDEAGTEHGFETGEEKPLSAPLAEGAPERNQGSRGP